jgi:hypothetical protein
MHSTHTTRFVIYGFLILGVVTGFADAVRVSCFRYLGETQLARVKVAYFSAVLRQA